MPDGIKRWDITAAEFRGFVKAKLESVDKKLDNMDNMNKDQNVRLNKVENRLTATEIKNGFFGFLGGIIGGFLAWIWK